MDGEGMRGEGEWRGEDERGGGVEERGAMDGEGMRGEGEWRGEGQWTGRG